jgi:hypothetical protein
MRGRDQEDGSLRPAWANRLRDPISKRTRAKWAGGVAQAVECLLCKYEVLRSNPCPTKKKRKKKVFQNFKLKTIGSKPLVHLIRKVVFL